MNVDKPTVIFKLKYGHSADEAINQIKERRYWEKIALDTTNFLLVGISYDKEAKTRDCMIERLLDLEVFFNVFGYCVCCRYQGCEMILRKQQ